MSVTQLQKSEESTSLVAFTDHQQAVQESLHAAHFASEAIETEEMAYIEAERGLARTRDQVSNLETGVLAGVSREKDEITGKPVFTNDVQRKAETSERLRDHKAYREAVSKLAEAEHEQRLRRIKIDKFSRDYSLARLAFEALSIGRRDR